MLVILASEFGLIQRRDDGIAYALALKNIGVQLGYMQYTASALGLGACAVGVGDSDEFARITGTNYYRLGSMGEMVLGYADAEVRHV